jgi:hypothetical protein
MKYVIGEILQHTGKASGNSAIYHHSFVKTVTCPWPHNPLIGFRIESLEVISAASVLPRTFDYLVAWNDVSSNGLLMPFFFTDDIHDGYGFGDTWIHRCNVLFVLTSNLKPMELFLPETSEVFVS